MSENAQPICSEAAYMCHCQLPPGHDGPHQCKPHCGGSWNGVYPDTFEVVSFPSGVPE